MTVDKLYFKHQCCEAQPEIINDGLSAIEKFKKTP